MTKNIWPKDVDCAVAVTIDVDLETLWLSRNSESMNNPCILSEGAYGAHAGVPRLLKMLKRLDVKATFFVPGWVLEKHTDLITTIVEEGHEVGYHGYLHEAVNSVEEEAELIDKCGSLMKRILGVKPVGYRYPLFGFRAGMVDILLDRGFEYSSNLMDRDHPYMHRGTGGRAIIELPTSWLFDDSSHFYFTLQNPPRRPIATPSSVNEIWKSEFEGIFNEGGSMVLVLHPQIIGRTSRIRMLEGLLNDIKSKKGTFIGPGEAIAKMFRAQTGTEDTNTIERRQNGE